MRRQPYLPSSAAESPWGQPLHAYCTTNGFPRLLTWEKPVSRKLNSQTDKHNKQYHVLSLRLKKNEKMRTTSKMISQRYGVNPFTTGNPFLGKKLLGFNIGRGSGALQGLRSPEIQFFFSFQKVLLTCCVVAGVSTAQGGVAYLFDACYDDRGNTFCQFFFLNDGVVP